MRNVEFIRVEFETLYNKAHYNKEDVKEEIRDSFKELIKNDSYIIKKIKNIFFFKFIIFFIL